MGNTPSQIPEPAVAETLNDRLRALEVKETSPEVEKGYVYVDDQERMLSTSERISPDCNTRRITVHSSSLLTTLSDGVHLNRPGMGTGIITRSEGTSPKSTSAKPSLSLSRTDLRCPLYHPMLPPRSSPNAPQRSQTPKPSISKLLLKVRPSPTSELPADAGSLPPPMSFV